MARTLYRSHVGYRSDLPYRGFGPDPGIEPGAAQYVVRVVGAPGIAFAPVVLADATVIDFRREKLPGLGRARFALPIFSADALWLDPDSMLNREIQIFRDGRCVWWGIPVQGEADLGHVVFTCVGLLWWLARLYFGPVVNNYLDPNADFENLLHGWTAVGVTASTSTYWSAKGNYSAWLVQATAGTDTYLRRRWTTTTGSDPVFFALKALLHIPPTGWVGPALDQRGLYMEVQSSPGGPLVPGTTGVFEPITNSTERGADKPIRLETGIFVPATITATVEVRLYAPGCTEGVYWDATAMTTEESVGSDLNGDFASVIVQRILAYAESKAPMGWDVVVEPGTTPVLRRHHQFFDNGPIFEGLMEYVRMGALEFDITWDPYGSNRTFRVWPYRRGEEKPTVLTIEAGVGSRMTWGVDCADVVTAPRWIGQGTDSRKEVGRAVDLSVVGRLLESVESAPPESPIDSLDARAQQTLAERRRPQRRPYLPIKAEAVFADDVAVGDTLRPSIDYGWIQEPGNLRRVSAMDVDCLADTVAFEWEDA